MIIAQQLQYKNRAEYLLYMWQVEDIIRAHAGDLDRLREGYLSRFQVDDAQRAALETWYGDLCTMMREEGKMERGHLQINRNVVQGLADVHQSLMQSSKFPYYRQMYYKVLPYLVELRVKNAGQLSDEAEGSGVVGELNLCFNLLYGLMLLRLQHRPVSPDTEVASKDVSTFLGQLSDYWKADRSGTLELE